MDGVRKGGVRGCKFSLDGVNREVVRKGKKRFQQEQGQNLFFRCVAPFVVLFFPLSLVMEWRETIEHNVVCNYTDKNRAVPEATLLTPYMCIWLCLIYIFLPLFVFSVFEALEDGRCQ